MQRIVFDAGSLPFGIPFGYAAVRPTSGTYISFLLYTHFPIFPFFVKYVAR